MQDGCMEAGHGRGMSGERGRKKQKDKVSEGDSERKEGREIGRTMERKKKKT